MIAKDHEVEEVAKSDPMKISTIRLMCTSGDTDNPYHPSVTELEKVVINNSNHELGKQYAIKTTLRFGSTDILMTAVDMETGISAQAVVTI